MMQPPDKFYHSSVKFPPDDLSVEWYLKYLVGSLFQEDDITEIVKRFRWAEYNEKKAAEKQPPSKNPEIEE